MTRSTDMAMPTHSASYAFARFAAAVVLSAAVVAGCGGPTNTRPTQPSPPPVPTAPTAPTPATPPKPAAPVPDKGDPQARFKAALELMKQKKSPDAENAFMDLTKDFPNYSGPLTDLGIIYAKSNRRDAAIAAFTKAATANGNNASAFNWLGIMNREAGQYERARQSYEKALQIKPGYAAAELNLGLLLDDYMKRPAEALVHYQNYDQLTGGNDLRVLPWIAEIKARQAPITGAGTVPPAGVMVPNAVPATSRPAAGAPK